MDLLHELALDVHDDDDAAGGLEQWHRSIVPDRQAKLPVVRAPLAATVFLALAGAATATGASATVPRVVDLDGSAVADLAPGGARAVVLLFLRADCPLSNRYAPEIVALQERYRDRHVAIWLVYPDPEATPASIRAHLAEHALALSGLRPLRDPHHDLAALAKVRVTPEAALLSPEGTLAYHGRIDDRYATLGRPRPAATRRDLEEAIDALLAGRPVATAETAAVGCAIADLAP